MRSKTIEWVRNGSRSDRTWFKPLNGCALETAAREEGRIRPYRGETELFMTPGFRFKVVDALLTNFHLPRTTLLMLVSALAGTEFLRRAYAEAVREQYRFYSYGDAML